MKLAGICPEVVETSGGAPLAAKYLKNNSESISAKREQRCVENSLAKNIAKLEGNFVATESRGSRGPPPHVNSECESVTRLKSVRGHAPNFRIQAFNDH